MVECCRVLSRVYKGVRMRMENAVCTSCWTHRSKSANKIVSKQFLVYPVSRSWTSDVPPPLLPREKDPECATHARRPPLTSESSDRGAEGTVDFFAGYVAQRRWRAFEQNRNLGKPSELAKLIMGALLNVIRKRAKQPINSPVCAAQCLMLSYGVPTCLHNVISCLLHVTASIASCYFVNACAHYVPTPLSHSARYKSLDHIAIIGTKKQNDHDKSTTPPMLLIGVGLPPVPHKLVNWSNQGNFKKNMADLLPDRLEVPTPKTQERRKTKKHQWHLYLSGFNALEYTLTILLQSIQKGFRICLVIKPWS